MGWRTQQSTHQMHKPKAGPSVKENKVISQFFQFYSSLKWDKILSLSNASNTNDTMKTPLVTDLPLKSNMVE